MCIGQSSCYFFPTCRSALHGRAHFIRVFTEQPAITANPSCPRYFKEINFTSLAVTSFPRPARNTGSLKTGRYKTSSAHSTLAIANVQAIEVKLLYCSVKIFYLYMWCKIFKKSNFNINKIYGRESTIQDTLIRISLILNASWKIYKKKMYLPVFIYTSSTIKRKCISIADTPCARNRGATMTGGTGN